VIVSDTICRPLGLAGKVSLARVLELFPSRRVRRPIWPTLQRGVGGGGTRRPASKSPASQPLGALVAVRYASVLARRRPLEGGELKSRTSVFNVSGRRLLHTSEVNVRRSPSLNSKSHRSYCV